MKKIEWKYKKTDIDISKIEEFQKSYGINLPEDFCELILTNNGARPKPNLFACVSGKERVFNNLLSFSKADKGNIYEVIDWLGERMPCKIIPVAGDPFGNFICIDYRIKSVKIVFWDHETNAIEDICNNFTDLMKILH